METITGINAFKEIYDVLQVYRTRIINEERLSVIIKKGLEIYSMFPHVKFSALYLIDDKTFNFELKNYFPDNSEIDIQESFLNLV